MLYFDSFPKILTTDYNNNGILLTNIVKRVEIIPELLKNPLLFYQYDLQEGDTPDIVGNKYYGDSYRYWLPLFANQTINPQWDWPLTSSQFDLYIKDKYAAAAEDAHINDVIVYTTTTIYEYRKIVTTLDSATMNETTNTFVIDEDSYNALSTGTVSRTFPNQSVVTETTQKQYVSIYDYELEKNEAKRTISIINSIYSSQIEAQFKTLIGA